MTSRLNVRRMELADSRSRRNSNDALISSSGATWPQPKLSGYPAGTLTLWLVVAAHRGAKEAVTELRDLARGIHPPVLDQGLGIALTTLAARSDLPVELVIDLPERPSAAIETIAYFCAAELLTNVTKHSGAQHATLEAAHMPGLLRVRVSDDGCGGARVEADGGLAGLAERIKTVDGRLQLSSPPGRPHRGHY